MDSIDACIAEHEQDVPHKLLSQDLQILAVSQISLAHRTLGSEDDHLSLLHKTATSTRCRDTVRPSGRPGFLQNIDMVVSDQQQPKREPPNNIRTNANLEIPRSVQVVPSTASKIGCCYSLLLPACYAHAHAQIL